MRCAWLEACSQVHTHPDGQRGGFGARRKERKGERGARERELKHERFRGGGVGERAVGGEGREW